MKCSDKGEKPVIAYIILAHQLFPQLSRLVASLQSSSAHFFVHVDRRASRRFADFAQTEDGSSLLSNPSVTMVEPREKVVWGGFRMVEAGLRACEMALRMPSVQRFKLLSGQDYPLKSTGEIEAFLLSSPGVSYLTGERVTGGWLMVLARYRWFIDHVRVWKPALMLLVLQMKLGLARKIPEELELHKGSMWWALSRQAVEYVHDALRERAGLKPYFRYAGIPDETMYPSLLLSPSFNGRVVQDNLLFEVWERPGDPHPRILGKGDLEQMLNSSKLFARKFDERVDGEVLDLIDRYRQTKVTPRCRGVDHGSH